MYSLSTIYKSYKYLVTNVQCQRLTTFLQSNSRAGVLLSNIRCTVLSAPSHLNIATRMWMRFLN